MTDKSRIEKAADAHEEETCSYGASYSFKTGVQWRDENPSPKMVAYIKCAETMIKLQQCPMDDLSMWHQIMAEGSKAVKALAEWDKK